MTHISHHTNVIRVLTHTQYHAKRFGKAGKAGYYVTDSYETQDVQDIIYKAG